jgi:N-acyl-D-aspartate/D-glutamate deacylase
VVKDLLLNPLLLPGFNDSGAHVTNMAFYDGNLRGLRIALEDSEETFSYMVKRLTSEPAEFFGLDAGSLAIGRRADMVLLNPQALKTYDGDARIEYIFRDEYDCHQLVNRSDGVVEGVFVAGKKVWQGTAFTETFGRERAGRALTVAG